MIVVVVGFVDEEEELVFKFQIKQRAKRYYTIAKG